MDWEGMKFDEEMPGGGKHRGGKKGDMVLWCDTCNGFVRIEGEYTGSCPVCEHTMFRMGCTRCGAKWYPRDPMVLPGTCAKCKTPYWNRERAKQGPRKAKAEGARVPSDDARALEEAVERARESREADA